MQSESLRTAFTSMWRAYSISHVDMPATPEKLWAAAVKGRRLPTPSRAGVRSNALTVFIEEILVRSCQNGGRGLRPRRLALTTAPIDLPPARPPLGVVLAAEPGPSTPQLIERAGCGCLLAREGARPKPSLPDNTGGKQGSGSRGQTCWAPISSACIDKTMSLQYPQS